MKIGFGRKKPAAAPVGEAAGDQLGAYPLKVDDLKSSHLRFHKNFRVEHIIIGCLLILCLVQANVIMQMFPLYRVVPFFVTFSDKDEQVVRIQPPTGNLRSLDILTEANVREYVKIRNTISRDDSINIARWGGKIENMSTQEIYDGFLSEIKPVYDAAKAGKFTRTTIIDAVAKVQDGYYRVDFTTHDRTIGSGLADTQEKQNSFSVELRAQNRPQDITYNNRFQNPLGFKVISYTVVPRRNSQN